MSSLAGRLGSRIVALFEVPSVMLNQRVLPNEFNCVFEIRVLCAILLRSA